MPILKIELTRLAANFQHPTSMRNAARTIDETVTATVLMAGFLAKQGRPAKEALERATTLDFGARYVGASLASRTIIDGTLARGTIKALAKIETSTSAEALERIQGSDPVRRYLAKINRALEGGNYTCRFSFTDSSFTLAELGLAANASFDIPWSGDVVLEPNHWNTASALVTGSGMGMKFITLNMAHDLGTYFELMKATPKALRFRGRGYRNRQALRVIAETTPLPVDPAEALGELSLAWQSARLDN